MISKIIPILFWLLAIIHAIPALSGLSTAKMVKLYDISPDDKNLMSLMQHRAILFGLVACACIYAACVASARWPVLIATSLSMVAFLVITLPRGQMSGPLGKIIIVDGVGVIIAAILFALMMRT